MARLLVLAIATCALAQERTWQQAAEDAGRLRAQGNVEEAAGAWAEACRLAEASGLAPKNRAALESTLAQALRLVGRPEEAEVHWRRAVQLLEDTLPALDPSLAAARAMLAGLEAENGRLDEAARDACTALEAAQGESPTSETVCLAVLARVSFGRRQYGTAMELMKLAIAKAREAEPEPGSLSFGLAHAVAALALGIGRDSVAARLLAEIEQMAEKARPNPADALDVARLGVELLIKQGFLEDAEQGGRRALDLNAKVSGNIPIPVAALRTSLARVALGQNDLERAAECIEQAEPALRRPGYDTRSELSAFLRTRAELRLRQGDRAAARVDLDEALRLDTHEGEHGLAAARTLLDLARLESGDGAHARAMEYAQRAARIFLREIGPSAAECHEACDTYGLLRKRALDAGLKEAPGLTGMRLGEALEPDAAATDAKVRELMAGAEGPDGLKRLDEALALRPGEPTLHSARRQLLEGMRRYEDAVAAADSEIAWSLDPKADMFGARARLHINLLRYDRAIVDATYALLLGGDDPMLRVVRGTARLGEGGCTELALRDLDVCAEARPDMASIQFLRGLALWELERWDDASSALRIAVAAGVQRGHATARLAWIERCRGNVDLALQEASQALDASPKGLPAYGVRGFIRLDRGEWKAALADFEAWAGDEPPSLYGRILQWICRAHLGEREPAAEALRDAIAGETEREDLRAVARAILGEGPAPAAEDPVPGSRAARGRACEASFLLGSWREIEGDLAGARAHYERAIAMDRVGCLEFHSAKAALARLAAGK